MVEAKDGMVHKEYLRRKTRVISLGRTAIGGMLPIMVQSMCATRTQDVEATIELADQLHKAGAGLVRLAIDSIKDAETLAQIYYRTDANLSADLQEYYRLVEKVAPYVGEVRYNPGHLHHHERDRSVRDKVAFIAEAAAKYGAGLRVGVNCGSVDPELSGKFGDDTVTPIVESALEHSKILDDLGFVNYNVSLKDSDPLKVIDANIRFAQARPDVPLHLGVTEAGLPPNGVNKSRFALGRLLSMGIGETLRISLTVPNDLKYMEVEAGLTLIDDVAHDRPMPELKKGLNIISCPSCSRVENEAFVNLARDVEEMTAYVQQHEITIAVMGCRVNGPGESDEADIGLWCSPTHVNLKRGETALGSYKYDEVLVFLYQEIDRLIASR